MTSDQNLTGHRFTSKSQPASQHGTKLEDM